MASNFDSAFHANPIMKSLSRGGIKKVKNMLLPSENVIYATTANYSIEPIVGKLSGKITIKGKSNCVIAITDKRIIIVDYRLGVGTTKQIQVSDIQSIDCKISLLNCPVRIKGLTEMFVIDGSRADSEKIMEALNKIRGEG